MAYPSWASSSWPGAYVAAKLRILVNQGNYDLALVPEALEVEALGGCARRVLFGSGPEAELSDRASVLWWGYDQYPDFEARGDHFRALVKGL